MYIIKLNYMHVKRHAHFLLFVDTISTHKFAHVRTYIYCNPQTECLVVSQHFGMARHVASLKLGWKPAQLYSRLSIRPLGQQAYHIELGNYEVLCSNSCSSVRLFTFYSLPDTRVFNSFEEL